MPTKIIPLEKLCWEWATSVEPEEITDDHVSTAYRLNIPPCRLGTCRRNCKAKPFCLNALGERVWFKEIDEKQWNDLGDPNDERRKQDSFVGLKNLGATCYVNTFLQLWFHNAEVRRALYMFREDLEGQAVTDEGTAEDWVPETICGHLQVIFALLEYSNRRYIDPSFFITHLGINASQQQDAQEFSKLFLCLLEDTLSRYTDSRIGTVIQEQFCGEYAYVTRCEACQSISRTPSKFYELDLNISGTSIQTCLQEFLKEEKLDNENQYMCTACAKKQNATRCIKLLHLPEVLNLQILRFVFNRKTGRKTKVNSCIQFPETLDMSKFIDKPDNTELYDLNAVLIHQGLSAYSGHYTAHIRGHETWYKFNDETVQKIAGKALKLSNEEETWQENSETQPPKRAKTAKGQHASKSAYMLVYKRRSTQEENEQGECPAEGPGFERLLPAHVQNYVLSDNEKFEDWVKDMISMRENNVSTGKNNQEEVKHTYQTMAIQPETGPENFEWLSVEWIKSWLNNPRKATVIKHEKYQCHHKCVNPDFVNKLKCINKSAADLLYSKFDGGPRLTQLCTDCVRQRCHLIRTNVHLEEDQKFIKQSLKQTIEGKKCYWVGKSSLRSWRRLVVERLEAEEQSRCQEELIADVDMLEQPTSEMNDSPEQRLTAGGDFQGEYSKYISETDMEISPTTSPIMAATTLPPPITTITTTSPIVATNATTTEPVNEDCTLNENGDSESSKANTETKPGFNEDLLCAEHDTLSPDENCRRLVTEDVWLRFKYYFPNCPEFSESADICMQCLNEDMEEAERKQRNKLLAAEQKSALLDVFHGKNRPSSINAKTGQVNVVQSDFLEQWRCFIRDPSRFDPVSCLYNTTLLCHHSALLYKVQDGLTPESTADIIGIEYLWPSEWESVKKFFSIDVEIRIVSEQIGDGSSPHVITVPELCRECYESRLQQEDLDRYQYEKAVIYVRKIVKDHGKKGAVIKDFGEESPEPPPDYPDPVYTCTSPTVNGSGTKRKIVSSDPEEVPNKLPSTPSDTSLNQRRSNRRRKIRGEKEITVISSMTLRDLKIQLMKVFSVPPFDQNLFIDTVKLTGDASTLSQLRVAPGAEILLLADEPQESVFVDDEVVTGRPEEGFKGTGLLGSI